MMSCLVTGKEQYMDILELLAQGATTPGVDADAWLAFCPGFIWKAKELWSAADLGPSVDEPPGP